MSSKLKKNVSIVLTGRVDENYTRQCLLSIQRNFLNPRVIISGWTSDEKIIFLLAKEFGVQKCILTPDPGSPLRNPKIYRLHNVNRIIVSSQNGIRDIKTKYVLRCRADLNFKNFNFTELLEKFATQTHNTKKILVSNITTVDARNGYKMLYHVNDWMHFGETKTVIDFFDIPLMPDDFCDWYNRYPKPEDKHDTGNLSKFMAEDWLTFNYISKKEKIKHDFYWDFNKIELAKWEKLLPKYFVVLPNNILGISNLKMGKIRAFHMWPYLSLTRYLQLADFDVGKIEILIDYCTRIFRKNLFSIWKLKEAVIVSLKPLIKNFCKNRDE